MATILETVRTFLNGPAPLAAPPNDGYDAAVNFLLSERIEELESRLGEEGWQRMASGGEAEFSREGLRKICHLSRLAFLKNPLINRAVTLQSYYVWGQGWGVQAPDEVVNEIVQGFMEDPANQAELTSHQARTLKEQDLQVDGNLFFAFFAAPDTGDVRVRTIPVDEIDEIICNPEDAKECWLYRRRWSQATFSPLTGRTERKPMTAFYPDWRYDPPSKPERMGDTPVLWGTPVYHVKVGGLSHMHFGVPETYAALDWAKAYKAYLEDWATITRALSRFAWNVQTRGGSAGVAAAKARLNTTLGTGGSGQRDTNPPPLVGSAFVTTVDGPKLDPIRTSGATTSAEDGRYLRLMVAAATGLPDTFLSGDVSQGTLATAKSLDRPTELKFRDRQSLWSDIFNDIFQYVLARKVGAPSGGLAEGADWTVSVTFPSILEHDVEQMVNSIIAAATLDGKTPVGTMDERTLVRLLLNALGIDQADEILDLVAPEGGESLMAQLRGERAAQAAAIAKATAVAPVAGQLPPPANGGPPADDRVVEAARALREALNAEVGNG